MAEIDLVSSHSPWAPLPTMVPWNKVGNGSIFDPMPARERDPRSPVWRNASSVRQSFGTSIQYSLQALTSWVTELNDPNLVLILLGDEQPASACHRPRGQPRGADLDHRPRPFRVQADCLLALAGRAAARSLRSARANGRLPQPVPRRLQHGLVPSGVGPRVRSTLTTAVSGPPGADIYLLGALDADSRRAETGPVSQGRWLVSLTQWTAANPRPCHWISLMQAEPRYSR